MRALGIQIDQPFIRAAYLEKNGSTITLHALKSAPVSDPENVKELYINKFKGRISSGLSSQNLLIRKVQLNVSDSRYINEALALQAEEASHANPSDALSIPHAIKKNGKKVEADLCTASREAIRELLDELKTLQITPDCISSNSLALVQYIRWKLPSVANAFVIDLGANEWTCVWMEDGELKKAHALKGGTEALLAALWSDRKKTLLPKEVDGVAKQIDLMQLKPNLNPHLSETLNGLRQELAKTIYSFYRISNKRPVIFTGRTDAFGRLCNFLEESFLDAISSDEPPVVQNEEEKKFAIPIGLALEQMQSPLQLLQQEFFPAKNWRKAGLYALILIFTSCLMSAGLWLLGITALERKKQELFSSIYPSVQRWDIQDPETEFLNDETIRQWTATVQSFEKESRYIAQAPRIAQLLSWISTHPLLTALKEEGDPIEITNFHYQLIDYPKIGLAKNQYRAKAEVEFQLKNPMNARKFHDALFSENRIIDASHPIEWESVGDGYRASFFLKNDRSPYVP